MFNGPWSTSLHDPLKELCLYQLLGYISARIKFHESTIKDTVCHIKKGNADTIKRLSPILESAEVRINELETILKYFQAPDYRGEECLFTT